MVLVFGDVEKHSIASLQQLQYRQSIWLLHPQCFDGISGPKPSLSALGHFVKRLVERFFV